MYQWMASDRWLNQYALRLQSQGAVFTVHYWGADENHFSNLVHKHSFFEICYVLDGEGTYVDQEMQYPLTAHTLFYSRPGITHQIQSTLGLQLLFVAFELDENQSSVPARNTFQALASTETVYMTDAEQHPAAQLWRSLLRRTDNQSTLPEALVPELAGVLINSLAALFNNQAAAPGPVPRRSSSALLKQAKRYIGDNLSDDELSLGKVAAHINLSSRQLSRLFSDNILESFTEYVRQQRVRKAGELLRRSDYSIKEIAEMTGFGSVHYFTRTFHALMQATPARYRDETFIND
ncbi:putative HTH-type transcriptional regulator YfiF [Paenibacillus baekrokdamisoli]|uniref:Putative HTH-type transcriptional regulator YfiF n=1 Tax=Paenibacillus baekrokdamisoli TaxID=1712516 RepID=A0A3G9JAR5_9BACL|nr:AraC family transcriptional regulator [Paenibacillus baekrokdamisoli]MBB3072917.1 AraC family L-rhamnose operon transcriptional activator RhaR [Paenibacillus baekrokdamisoli]BBH21993.1 putative HTH-type transcriptional regulator YfiF [Paenibacillus baekrokdamisoli]